MSEWELAEEGKQWPGKRQEATCSNICRAEFGQFMDVEHISIGALSLGSRCVQMRLLMSLTEIEQ